MGVIRNSKGKPVHYVPSTTTIRERMLLVALVEFAPDIRPSLTTLGIMVGLGWREVRRLLKTLEQRGLIRVESRPGQANRYHLTLPTPVKADNPVGTDNPVGVDRITPVGTDRIPLSELTPEADKKADKKSRGGPRATRQRPAHPLPPDWKPNSKHEAIALEAGLNLNLVAEKFRSHAKANDRRQADWDASFTHWLLDERAPNPKTNGKLPAPQRGLATTYRAGRFE